MVVVVSTCVVVVTMTVTPGGQSGALVHNVVCVATAVTTWNEVAVAASSRFASVEVRRELVSMEENDG